MKEEWLFPNAVGDMALAQPKPEPVQFKCTVIDDAHLSGITLEQWSKPQRKPLTHEQRVDLLTKFESRKHEWHALAILLDMVEAAHGIKENT